MKPHTSHRQGIAVLLSRLRCGCACVFTFAFADLTLLSLPADLAAQRPPAC